MKRFECSCGQAVFFDNSSCTRCGMQLGFDSTSLTLKALRQTGEALTDDTGQSYRSCRNTRDYGNCSWQ